MNDEEKKEDEENVVVTVRIGGNENENENEDEWVSGDELELFENDAGFEDKSKNGSLSKLLSASEFGNAEMVKEALDIIEDEYVNARGEDGDTALHLGCLYGHFDVVRVLLEDTRVDCNASDDDKGTPLQDASASGFIEIVELLLKKESIDVNAKDCDGDTALDCAIRGEHSAIIDVLKNAGAREGAI